SAAELVGGDQREVVGLVEVEQPPHLARTVDAIAARERVCDPTEKAFRQLLADEQLEAEDAADPGVVEDLRARDAPDRLDGVGADDQVVEALVESLGADEYAGQGPHLRAERRLPGPFRNDGGISERIRSVAIARAFGVQADPGLERQLLGRLPARRQARTQRPARMWLRRPVPVQTEPHARCERQTRQHVDAALDAGARREARIERWG